MVTRDELVACYDALLAPPVPLRDASNNGLQVQGGDAVARVVFGVDACADLFDEAVAMEADMVVVHHGLSWGDGIPYITGPTAARIGTLLRRGVSLYASHLPLDGHPVVGNNAVIAGKLGVVDGVPFHEYGGFAIGVAGALAEPLSLADLVDHVGERLEADCRAFPGGAEPVRGIGIVSGGGASALADCPAARLECLVTGEITHQHVHEAREAGVSVITAGHYRTEVFGVQALMARTQATFPVECAFVDLPTGL